jgi:hypothetical protein
MAPFKIRPHRATDFESIFSLAIIHPVIEAITPTRDPSRAGNGAAVFSAY